MSADHPTAIYESARCYVDHQHGPGQDYWYIGDTYDGYGAPQWPTAAEMLTDLRHVVEALEAEVCPESADGAHVPLTDEVVVHPNLDGQVTVCEACGRQLSEVVMLPDNRPYNPEP